jgi:hypothetical protein
MINVRNTGTQITKKISLTLLAAMLIICNACSSPDAGDFSGSDSVVDKYLTYIMERRYDDADKYEYGFAYGIYGDGNNLITGEDRPRVMVDFTIDYVIKERTKINDDLYVYTTLLESEDFPDRYWKIYYYVVHIDGQFYLTDAYWIIPEELREGLDVSKFEYATRSNGPPETGERRD